MELKHQGKIAYREALPAGVSPQEAPVALLLHGFPESSYMWRGLMPRLADAGWRAIAPDFPGSGDSEPDPPSTWERRVETVEDFVRELGLERVALVVHDWGGLIGLRWACDHPGAVGALVISATGFFPDGRWHGLAQVMRTEGQGEEVMQGFSRDGFVTLLSEASSGIDEAAADEYWKGFTDDVRRRGHLELYRSGDFEKLHAYDGKLGGLGVPSLVIWGENDAFAPVGGAHRFRKQLPDVRFVVIEGAGHFAVEDESERFSREVVEFLSALPE